MRVRAIGRGDMCNHTLGKSPYSVENGPAGYGMPRDFLGFSLGASDDRSDVLALGFRLAVPPSRQSCGSWIQVVLNALPTTGERVLIEYANRQYHCR
jgi:hypothetical protein